MIFFAAAGTPPIAASELTTDDQELLQLAKQCVEERDPHKKGRMLEEFFESVVLRERCFCIIKKHLRTETGELDYVLRQSIDDGFWKDSPYVVVECKNWADPIGPEQVHHFLTLVRDTGPKCSIGLYLTVSPLTPAALQAIRDARLRDGITAVTIASEFFPKLTLGLRGLIPRLYEKQTFRAD